MQYWKVLLHKELKYENLITFKFKFMSMIFLDQRVARKWNDIYWKDKLKN